MSQQKSNIGNKAKEYLALLKNKTTQELIEIREYLRNAFKSERAKSKPDSAVLQNHNIQLSLVGRELKNRKPTDEKDRSDAVRDSTINEVHSQSFEERLKEKSLDELNAMIINGKKKLEQLAAMKSEPNIPKDRLDDIEEKLNHFSEKAAVIETEITSRSKSAAEEAKSDLNRAEGKLFGVDKDYLVAGAVGGIVVGAIASSFGKNIWAYGVLGIGIGSGLVWLNKNVNTQKTTVVQKA